MPGPDRSARRGRRGLRTSEMIRVARERIDDLFAAADSPTLVLRGRRADRYVRLARRIGARYNVRLPREFRSRYCRRCSAHWGSSTDLRVRLRSGRVAFTCRRCGAVRRIPIERVGHSTTAVSEPPAGGRSAEVAMVGEEDEIDDGGSDEES